MEMDNGIILRRETTACFTGHRPEKLPDSGNRHSTATRVIKSMLYARVADAVNDGYDTFITGMQRGIDLWAGEIVLSLMAQSNLRLVCAIPYEGFGKEFTGVDRWTYERLLESSSAKITLCPHYTKDCMALRNRFMVDNSSRLIAVANDPKSGTGQTLRYARSSKLDIRLIDLGELFRKNNTDTRDYDDFEANKQSYTVITFDSIEDEAPAAFRSENIPSAEAMPSEMSESAAANLFCKPFTDTDITENPSVQMHGKGIAESPSGETGKTRKTPDGMPRQSAGNSANPLAGNDDGISAENNPGNSHRRTESPAAEIKIDQRYNAVNDPTLTLL